MHGSNWTVILPILILGCSPGGKDVRPEPRESGHSQTTTSWTTVAWVGEVPIFAEDLRREHQRHSHRTALESLLSERLDEGLLSEAALREGLDRDPDLARTWRKVLACAYLERHLKLPANDEEALRRWHAGHADLFAQPETRRGGVVRARLDRTASAEGRARLRLRLETARAEAAACGTNALTFAEVVRQNSEDTATRYRGGDTGWLDAQPGPDGAVPPLAAALFSMATPGAVSFLFEWDGWLGFVRLADIRPSATSPFEAVRGRVALLATQEAERQARHELLAGLRTDVGVRVDSNALARLAASFHASLPERPPTKEMP